MKYNHPVPKRRRITRKSRYLNPRKNSQFLGRKIGFLLVLLLGFCLLFWFFILKDLPSPRKLISPDFLPYSTQILDRNGQLLYDVYTEKNRTPIKLAELPEYIKWATIASEDKNFYRHQGFAVTGIIRGAINTVFRRSLQGGSTISQQLVKNTLLTQERTVRRKIREALLTVSLEVIYSKDEILAMYLNQTPYGGTAYGISAASQMYFGKEPTKLTLAETALLAGLPASPTRYSPFGAQPELAKKRQEYVLDQMLALNKVNQAQVDQAKSEKLNFTIHDQGIKAPHFVMWVKNKLTEQFGEQLVDAGGLKVTTTLDIELQDFAQQAVASEVAKLKKENVTNGAALITNPKTGEILAMVGSKDYFADDIDGNVNVTTSLRQPGSSIKPLNYALAIDRKIITPASLIIDIPTCFDSKSQKRYCPDNYDRQFHGAVQTRFALGNSYNIPAVKTLTFNGLSDFVASASAMGITSFTDPKNYGLSLTLGGGEVRMVDMATAFSTLVNAGRKVDLTGILKVEKANGEILYEHKTVENDPVISPETAYLISHILLDNNARQPMFGQSSYLVIKNHPEVSVKTGTTNDKKDNWTIGYTPSFLTAVWVGNNNNKPMSAVASGITGASPIWNKIMRFALEKNDKEAGKNYQEWPVKPDGIVGASICVTSGLLAGDSGCSTRFEYFIEGTVPRETENLKRQIQINKLTGQAIQPGQNIPPEQIETQEHPVVSDLSGSILCLDCPFPTDPAIFRPETLKK